MNHTRLCLPSRSWSSFTDPGGMEGWVGSQLEIRPILCNLHQLWVPDHIKFSLAILIFHCGNNTAPTYSADAPSYRQWPENDCKLVVQWTRLKTVSDHALGVVVAHI